MKFDELIEWPLYLQVAIGCGFIAYMIAMHGRRKDEKAIDLTFGVIAFSLPSVMPWMAAVELGVPSWIGILISILVSVVIGATWRKSGKKLFYSFMYEAEISTDEGYKTTWQRIIQDVDIVPRQIFVTLKSGKVLSCDHIQKFKDSAISLSSIDDDGNIAIYVTHVDGEEEKETAIRDEEWGDLITYIPASEVHSVDFRCSKK